MHPWAEEMDFFVSKLGDILVTLGGGDVFFKKLVVFIFQH